MQVGECKTYQELGEVLVGDIGEFGTVVFGDYELDGWDVSFCECSGVLMSFMDVSRVKSSFETRFAFKHS